MNDQQRAAMTMALEALEVLLTCKHGEFCDHYRDAERQSRLAITALREALRNASERMAQPSYDHAFEVVKAYQRGVKDAQTTAPPVVPQGEPVASLDSDGFPWSKEGVECRTTPDTYKPLYTTPPSVEAIAEWYLIAQQYKTECEQAVEAAIEATKEKAAKVCEELGWRDSSEFAAAIRGMK